MAEGWKDFLVTSTPLPPGGSVPIRKEIRELSVEELNLFREGLARFQHYPEDKDDPKSWYQIAGIHGLPYETWPDRTWNKAIPRKVGKRQFAGFCTHNSILFLTWHRPYLSLFEQILCKHVNDVADGIDDGEPRKKNYVTAARSFRLPYWDWARRGVSSHFPEAALSNTYDRRNVPKSSKSWFDKNPSKPVYNPLYQAPFPEGADSDITMDQPVTARYPGDPDAKRKLTDAINNFYSKQKDPIAGGETNLSERVAYILLGYHRYGPMSNNRYRPVAPKDPKDKPEIWGSLEDIHNSVHRLAGGNKFGQMSNAETSAFDPIFWLHHANIDRLFAIWQALHGKADKDTWVTPLAAGSDNWATPYDTEENMNSPLYPFRPTETTWYDSRRSDKSTSVERTERFGYSYRETSGLKYPLSEDADAKLRATVNDLYINFTGEARRSRAGDLNAGDRLLPQVAVLKNIQENKIPATHDELAQLVPQIPEIPQLIQNSIGPEKPYIKDLIPNLEYLEWLVNLKAERHALGGKYSVSVFLDAVEEDNPALWPFSPHYVGSFVPFGQASDTGCGNCQDQQESRVEVTSQIPLTIALVERYLAQILPDLKEDTVVPYLTKNLHWRVQVDGNILENRADVAGLTVFVVSNKVTIPEDDSLPPIYDPKVKVYPKITTNLNGEGRGDGTGLTAGN